MAAAAPPEESSLAPSPLTQTQPIAAPTQGTQIGSPNQDLDVYARLISLIDPSAKLELRASSTQVHIGRHTECDIQVGDKRVSARHLRIYRDDAFRYFVETLSSNGCFVNEHFMQKGDTRALKHGDELSIGVSALSAGGSKPFAAYIFMVADHRRELGDGVSASSREASTGSNGAAAGGASGSGRPNKLVTEQWVQSRWDIRIMLGSGNFSEVHLGVEVKTGEKLAVKVIDVGKFQQFQSKRESQLSLVSEAELLTSLKHDNIVCFREWFQTDSKLYLVMEFMEGGDLLQSILDDGHFAELQARRLFKRVCEAVQYLHSMGVVHRDLKPENILLTSRDREKGEPKIADFGLARKNLQSRDCKTFCGTPHYFAPEVINTFRERETGRAVGYGKTVDMWSLGVILYILLSGIPPFEEDGLYEQILDGRYEFDVQEWRLVSPEAKELVRGLMTVNPKERLTIQQALEGRWLRLASGPSTFEREVPMGGEPASKRLRAGESATIGTGAASSTSPPEL